MQLQLKSWTRRLWISAVFLRYSKISVFRLDIHKLKYQTTSCIAPDIRLPKQQSLLECNKLERKKAEILYPHLMEWMTSARPQVYPLQLCGPRKKRKTFSNHELKVLLRVFEQKSRPSPQEVREVACSLHLDPVIVKRWFYNRYHRCKAKKQN